LVQSSGGLASSDTPFQRACFQSNFRLISYFSLHLILFSYHSRKLLKIFFSFFSFFLKNSSAAQSHEIDGNTIEKEISPNDSVDSISFYDSMLNSN